MKRICAMILLAMVLTGCSQESRELSAAMELRNRLLKGSGCSFQGRVTADYGDSIHEFSMDCTADALGKVSFSITEPESISGIRGELSEAGGNILFEDQALYFPLLTDDLLSPASAPWILVRTLRSGCLTAACREGEQIHLSIDDSFADDALHLDIWLEEDVPIRADILHGGRRILSVQITDFTFL